jgi:hypothetical protein
MIIEHDWIARVSDSDVSLARLDCQYEAADVLDEGGSYGPANGRAGRLRFEPADQERRLGLEMFDRVCRVKIRKNVPMNSVASFLSSVRPACPSARVPTLNGRRATGRTADTASPFTG